MDIREEMNMPRCDITDEQAAEYLENFREFCRRIKKMKDLGYSKTELKKEIDLIYARF